MAEQREGADEPTAAEGEPAATHGEPAGPAAGNAAAAAGNGGPASLLTDVRRWRSDARAARHAYWLPLVLFGLVIGASSPLYVGEVSPGPEVVWTPAGTFEAFRRMFVGSFTVLAIYWLLAIGAGLYLTWRWYQRHGRQVGLMTPSRGFVRAGVIVGVLLLVLPVFPFLPGDLTVRGLLPLLIIAAVLWVLARAERSPALAMVAALFTGAALLSSLYNTENILFRLGWTPRGSEWSLTDLPNILLPALILLVSGAVAYLLQRRKRAAA
jgi:hypothetical protein